MANKVQGLYAPDNSMYVTLSDGSGTTTGPGSAGSVGIDQTNPGTTNAVAMEAQYLTTLPTYTSPAVNLVQMSNKGALLTTLVNGTGSAFASLNGNVDAQSPTNTGLGVVPYNYVYNGTTWDRQRGDTNGAWAVSKGSGTLTTTQITVGTTATLILSAGSNRGAVTITNLGTTDIFIGNSAGILTTTGALLLGAKGSSITLPYTGAIYGIVGTGTQAVSVMITS